MNRKLIAAVAVALALPLAAVADDKQPHATPTGTDAAKSETVKSETKTEKSAETAPGKEKSSTETVEKKTKKMKKE